jgi:soluble lytic murein transglycosylase
MPAGRLKRTVFSLLAASLCAALGGNLGFVHAATAESEAPGRSADAPSLAREQAPPGSLSQHDVALYRRIFDLQSAGDFAAADPLIAKLDSPILLGHVLFQRYMHPTAYRSSYAELEGWLEHYADHPDADQVYRLALRRRPPGAAGPQLPVPGYLAGAGQELQELVRPAYRSDLDRSPAEEEAIRGWRLQLEQQVADGRPEDAEAALDDAEVAPLLDPAEQDIARWTIARGYLSIGDYEKALSLAGRAAARSGRVVPEIHWTAGISAWQLAKIQLAAWHFSNLADSTSALPAERSRAAFWAARAYLVGFRPHLVSHFLRIAAGSRDFYGLLGRKVLGETSTYKGDPTGRKPTMQQVLLRFPDAQRALALGQVGQIELAEREIRKLASRASPELMVGLIGLAQSLDLPAAQMRLAQSLGSSDGSYHIGALFPLPNWQPSNGYTVDRALVYSIMRAESGFDPSAESAAGARGLMQLMPATARYLARQSALELPGHDALFEPETSIRFGQAYLEHLLRWSPIGGNLIYPAVGYNAGPARIARWREELQIDDDPLLFLELIPMREPRVYVKNVLTNLWNYRARLGQPQPELEALARNQWPSYRALDSGRQLHAWK